MHTPHVDPAFDNRPPRLQSENGTEYATTIDSTSGNPPVRDADLPPLPQVVDDPPAAHAAAPASAAPIVQQSIAQETIRVERPARVLLGWLPDDRARLIQTGFRQGVTLSPEGVAAIESTRAAVASRPDWDQRDDHVDVISDAPPALEAHIAALRQHPAAAPLFAEGWTVAIVDLRRVHAAQPTVFVDQVEDRVAGFDPDDVFALARLTLPLATAVNIPAQFDVVRQAWMVTAPNPNLRIMGNGAVPGPNGVLLGFAVTIAPSFLNVAHFRGRYILRDGYHRAYGLLKRGITHAPALVRDFHSVEELAFPIGLLPQEAYLGRRPAMLRDYLDDAVSADVRLPATLKMLVIQALELTPTT